MNEDNPLTEFIEVFNEATTSPKPTETNEILFETPTQELTAPKPTRALSKPNIEHQLDIYGEPTPLPTGAALKTYLVNKQARLVARYNKNKSEYNKKIVDSHGEFVKSFF